MHAHAAPQPLFGQPATVGHGFVANVGADIVWVDVEPVYWTAPTWERLLIRLHLICPRCDYPLQLCPRGPEDIELSPDGSVGLTIRVLLSCPARWQARDEAGRLLVDDRGRPEMVRCGWRGVVCDGTAHSPDCAVADLRRGGTSCTCGPGSREEEEE